MSPVGTLPGKSYFVASAPSYRESSATERLRGRKGSQDQGPGERSDTFPENAPEEIDDDAPVVVTRESVLRDLRRIQRRAEADGAHPSALRSVELAAKIGLAPEKSGADGGGEEMSPSPAVLLGLPITGSLR